MRWSRRDPVALTYLNSGRKKTCRSTACSSYCYGLSWTVNGLFTVLPDKPRCIKNECNSTVRWHKRVWSSLTLNSLHDLLTPSISCSVTFVGTLSGSSELEAARDGVLEASASARGGLEAVFFNWLGLASASHHHTVLPRSRPYCLGSAS